MKPRTLRERLLVSSALELLNEANVVSLDNTAKTEAEKLCKVDFAGKADPKKLAARSSSDPTVVDKDYKGPLKGDAAKTTPGKKALKGLKINFDNWTKISAYSNKEYESKMRHDKMNNADIGTFTEYFAGEYLYQRFKADGDWNVELFAQGNHTNPGPGSAMVVVKDQFYRRVHDKKGLIGYTQALMTAYREYGFGQGELAWQAMKPRLESEAGVAYAKAKKTVKIMLVGSSFSNVGSPGLLGQEDMQVLFPDDGNPMSGNAGNTTDNLITFSNKSGGSNPRQINKTASSVGLCTPAQLKAALADLKRTKGDQPGIVESSVDMFLKLNKEVEEYWDGDEDTDALKCYQYLYKSAYGNANGGTRGDAEEYDEIEWDKLSDNQIKELLYGITDGIFDKNTDAFDPPEEDKAGCMKKTGTKSFTSFSTCVTTVLGRLGGAIAMGALKTSNITTSNQFYDMLILGTNPEKRESATSILGTMYPAIFEMVLDMHTEKDKNGADIEEHKGKNYTREQIATAIKDRLDGIDGRYFSVNETHETAEKMEDVHAGFRGMIDCVAGGDGGDFKIISSNDAGKGDSNASYFVYDCKGTYHAFMTLTLRKNSGSNYSLGGATLNNIEELVKAAEADDDGSAPEEQAEKLGAIDGSLEQTSQKVDIPKNAEGAESVTDGEVKPKQPHAKPHPEDLPTSVKKLVDDGDGQEAAKEELKKMKSELQSVIDKAAKSSKDPNKLTTKKIQDELLSAIPDHKTNKKVAKLVAKFEFASLATFNRQPIDIQKDFVKALLKIVPNDKLKALHDKLIKENSRRRSMSGTYLDLIQETISFVLREADDSELIDTFVEDLFAADPDKAGEVMSVIADDVTKAMEAAEETPEEEPEEAPDENIEEIQEGRWLKLAGILKG